MSTFKYPDSYPYLSYSTNKGKYVHQGSAWVHVFKGPQKLRSCCVEKGGVVLQEDGEKTMFHHFNLESNKTHIGMITCIPNLTHQALLYRAAIEVYEALYKPTLAQLRALCFGQEREEYPPNCDFWVNGEVSPSEIRGKAIALMEMMDTIVDRSVISHPSGSTTSEVLELFDSNLFDTMFRIHQVFNDLEQSGEIFLCMDGTSRKRIDLPTCLKAYRAVFKILKVFLTPFPFIEFFKREVEERRKEGCDLAKELEDHFTTALNKYQNERDSEEEDEE